MYVKADFIHDADRDVYVCPAAKTLSPIHDRGTQRSGTALLDWNDECQTCTLFAADAPLEPNGGLAVKTRTLG